MLGPDPGLIFKGKLTGRGPPGAPAVSSQNNSEVLERICVQRSLQVLQRADRPLQPAGSAVDPQSCQPSRELLDAAAGVFIRFRLGGITFPPNIYYKIFTHRPIADVCASSPKDYTQPGLKKPVPRQTNNGWPPMQEDRSGWYQRMENNSWRLFCSKMVPIGQPMVIGANKKIDFHYSRLQRQQDVDRWRKRRKIEWLRQMYNRGRLQTHPVHQRMATLAGSSAHEVMDTTEERGDDEVEERELDELLAWTTTLSFEEYMQEWRRLACSHSSEPSKDLHS
ncbi:protein MFI isoform X1 [Xiphias gladius]|uniref:protein MFI isoform X1 n=1 Tax=Xiphias gladius TaxID=8245 RepID=UPI001A99A2C1|nr:protein MFI isoform X1 [Xiphias gladius]